MAKGLEIQGRLQYAGDQYALEDLVFHPHGFAGVMGSAVAASTMLQLDVDAMRNALGLAWRPHVPVHCSPMSDQ